jgi:hypothetical protein
LKAFKKQEWVGTVYGKDLKEELPPNAPKAWGKGMRMCVFVDSDHAGDTVSRKSRTDFFVFLQYAPIYWCSKKQDGIETSSFVLNLSLWKRPVSMFVDWGTICAWWELTYCVSQPYIYSDNQSVLCNTTILDSKLKKKANSVAYHSDILT